MAPIKKALVMTVVAVAASTASVSLAQPDSRQLVELPPMMSQHMLANMRDHLMAIHAIQQALADDDFDTAADVAENRLGMSSLTSHGASHMAAYMPDEMQTIGTGMHHAASQFAVITHESAVDEDMQRALRSLSQVTQQCVACHNAYRIR